MAWPPPVPPATRTNTTGQLDAHPADHNQISAALTELVNRANAGPAVWRVGQVGVTFSSGAGTLTFPAGSGGAFPNTCAGCLAQLSAGSVGAGGATVLNSINVIVSNKTAVTVQLNSTFSGSLNCWFIAWGT